jgi:cation diffusion facilitator CzcD-associated flavoprotein CzcO
MLMWRTGSSGLSMLKTFRDDGFDVTCYERRTRVGGLWSYSDDPKVTSALKSMVPCNISPWQFKLIKCRYMGKHQQVYLWHVGLPNARQYVGDIVLIFSLTRTRISALSVST